MRIAHVITRMIVGGAQENTLHTCRDLIRNFNDDVLLITGPSPGPEGDLLRIHEASHEIPTAEIRSLRRAIHPWRDLAAWYELNRVLAKFKPDVVHTHSAKGGILGRLAAHRLGVPAIVHTVHGAPFHPYENFASRLVYRTCERFAASRCHAFISVADAMTGLMVDSGVADREKFTTIYSGMEVAPFLNAAQHRDRVRKELGFTDDQIVVGKVARLQPLKGHVDLLAAARTVLDACPQVRFLLVGDGVLRAQLERQIRRAGLADHFCFTGLVRPTDVPALIGAMDVLVHVSLREGLARALPQALLAGKPVVSYDIDGAREVCLPAQTGYLIPASSIQPLADALIKLARDDALRRKLGAEGRRLCAGRFDHEFMTREIRRLYESLLT